MYILFSNFCMSSCVSALQFSLNSFCVEDLEMGASRSGLFIALFAVAFTLCALPVGFISAKLTERTRQTCVLASLFAASVLSLVSYFLLRSEGFLLVVLLVAAVIGAVAVINLHASFYSVALAAEGVSANDVASWFVIASTIANVYSPIAVGLIADALGSYRVIFAWAAAHFFASLLALYAAMRTAAAASTSPASAPAVQT